MTLRAVVQPGSVGGSPRVFVVSYGQHPIGIARAHGADEAALLIGSLFLGELETEKLNIRDATPDERVAYAKLLAPDEHMVAGVLL